MESTKFSLEGKTILITGASSGIGMQTAIETSRLGANLILTARNVERLNKTLNKCIKGDNKIITADLTNYEELTKLVLQIKKLDGIVHSAGIVNYIPSQFINEKNIYELMDINYKSPAMLTSLLLRKKKINEIASIVFISSIAAINSAYGASQYASSKAAIEGYSRTLAIEIAPKKMRSNCLQPAIVKTKMVSNYQEKTKISDQEISNLEKDLPLGFGTAKDVANAIVFLLSNESRWITGQSIKMGNY